MSKDGEEIRTKESLIKLLGTIDDEQEAMSLVYVLASDLLIDKNILVGHTYELENSNGFLVQVTNKNTYGCGTHEHLKVIYLVSRNGEVNFAVSELPDENSELGLCID